MIKSDYYWYLVLAAQEFNGENDGVSQHFLALAVAPALTEADNRFRTCLWTTNVGIGKSGINGPNRQAGIHHHFQHLQGAVIHYF